MTPLRLLRLALLLFLAAPCVALSEEERETRERDVVVNAENDEGEHDQFLEMGEYGQPAWAERNHASTTVNAYVLSPFEASLDLTWEGDFPRHGKPTHEFRQEIELGLPYRFELGFENTVGVMSEAGHATSGTFEIRWAPANWNKIPLNPALSAEYVAGWGKSVQSAGGDNGSNLKTQHDGMVTRLLLAQDFKGQFGYAANLSWQQNLAHSGGQFELSQCVTCGLMEGRFEAGAEMRYIHSTRGFIGEERDDLVVGPTGGWKPTRQTRLNVSPLFGCTHDSPVVSVLAVFSYEFGGAEAILPETPRTGH